MTAIAPPSGGGSLRQKTFTAFVWSVAQRGGQQMLRFVVSLVLARLLAPHEFGLVAMITVFMAISEKFIYAGFGSALIQKPDLNERDCATVFYFNLGVALSCYGLLFAAAPAIAAFYHQPVLALVLRVAAFKLVLDALCLVQTSLMARRMDFRTPTLIVFASVAVSGILGVALAFHGAGVWSLVWMSLSQRAIYAALCWSYGRWRLRAGFDRDSFRYCWSYGSRLLGGNLIDAFFENLYDLVVGRFYSALDLGFFTRGQSLQQLVVQNVVEPARNVLFSAFAQVGGDQQRLRNAFSTSIGTLTLLLAPALTGMGLLAHRLVPLLYSDRWAASVPFLQLFCLIGFFMAFRMVCINVFKATGRTDLVLKLQLAGRSFSLVSIALTFRSGLQTMLLGECIASFLSWLLFAGRASRLVGLGPLAHLRHVWPALSLALFMGACVFALDRQLGLPDLAAVPLLAAVGSSIYLGLAWWLRFGDLHRLVGTTLSALRRRRARRAVA